MPIICLALLVSAILLFKQNKSLRKTIDDKQANVESYQGIINRQDSANNVLKLSIEDLRDQNDYLLNRTDSIRSKLKIKTDEVTTAMATIQHINTQLKAKVKVDTLYSPNKDTVYLKAHIDTTFRPNKQTAVAIKLVSDTINVNLHIDNDQYLYITNHREYRHNKSFIHRLFTLDFKKRTVTKYRIYNTNDLVNIGDTRVIENTDK